MLCNAKWLQLSHHHTVCQAVPALTLTLLSPALMPPLTAWKRSPISLAARMVSSNLHDKLTRHR